MSAAARHPKFRVKAGGSQIRERVRAFADGFQLVVQVGMDLRFGFGGLSAVVFGGKLAGGLRLRLRHGGNDFGELLAANTGWWKIRRMVGGEFFHALKCVRFVSLNICHNDLPLLVSAWFGENQPQGQQIFCTGKKSPARGPCGRPPLIFVVARPD